MYALTLTYNSLIKVLVFIHRELQLGVRKNLPGTTSNDFGIERHAETKN